MYVKDGYDWTATYASLTPSTRDIDLVPPILGTTYKSTDGKAFRFVQNTRAVTAYIGDVLCLSKTANYPNEVAASNEDSCGATTTDVATIMAGVAMGDIAAGYYGWVQFKGIGTARVDGGTADVAVGDSLIQVDDAVYVVQDAAYTSAPTLKNHLRARVAVTHAHQLTSVAVTLGANKVLCTKSSHGLADGATVRVSAGSSGKYDGWYTIEYKDANVFYLKGIPYGGDATITVDPYVKNGVYINCWSY